MSIEPIRIELPLGIMFQSVNAYLIPGDQLTLIDCGLFSPENWIFFQKKIEEHGFKVNEIDQIIITHEHRDHIGMLPELIAHSDAVIYAPKNIEGWFSQPDEMMKSYDEFNASLFQTFGIPDDLLQKIADYLDGEVMARKIEAMDRFKFFQEGDNLKIGEEDWKVLHTPGHCPNQYVFIQEQQKKVFGSDMLLPIAPMPIIVEDTKNPGYPTRSLHDLLNSFQRLLKYDFQTVYPGHGPIFVNANAIIEKQLDRIAMRKEECFEAIKNGLSTPYQINRKMYPYQNMPPDFSGMFMVMGYIDLLEEERRVMRKMCDNGQLRIYLA